MKRIFCLLLMLALLTACAEEANPTVRYENDDEQEGAALSMALEFAGPVAKGSVIKLLNGETEVLSLAVESETKTLTLRSDKLEKNVAYTLTVNGVMQAHGTQSLEPPAPMEDIPDQPTIPMEPMSEQPSEGEGAGGFTPGAGTQAPMGQPPENMGQPPEDMPEPPEGFGEKPGDIELIPPNGGRPDRQPPAEEGRPDLFAFTLTSENQSFTNVRDAVKPEGKEPNA